MRRASHVLIAIVAAGCSNGRTTGTNATPASTAPVNAAELPESAASPWSRAPAAVKAAFVAGHSNATVQRVRPHMQPDGSIHYLVTFRDGGVQQPVIEFLADGSVYKSN